MSLLDRLLLKDKVVTPASLQLRIESNHHHQPSYHPIESPAAAFNMLLPSAMHWDDASITTMPASPPSVTPRSIGFKKHVRQSSNTLPFTSGSGSSYLAGESDYCFHDSELERLWQAYDEMKSSETGHAKLEAFAHTLMPYVSCQLQSSNYGSLTACQNHEECCQTFESGGSPLRVLLRLKADLVSDLPRMRRAITDCIQSGQSFFPSTNSRLPSLANSSNSLERSDAVVLASTIGPFYLPMYILFRLASFSHNRRVLLRADLIPCLVKIAALAASQYSLSIAAMAAADKGEVDEFVEDGPLEDEEPHSDDEPMNDHISDRRHQLRRMQMYLETVLTTSMALCSQLLDPTHDWKLRSSSRPLFAPTNLNRASSVAPSVSMSLPNSPVTKPADSSHLHIPTLNNIKTAPSSPKSAARSAMFDDSGIVEVISSLLHIVSALNPSKVTSLQLALLRSTMHAAGAVIRENKKAQSLFLTSNAISSLSAILHWRRTPIDDLNELSHDDSESSPALQRNRIYQRRLIDLLFGIDYLIHNTSNAHINSSSLSWTTTAAATPSISPLTSTSSSSSPVFKHSAPLMSRASTSFPLTRTGSHAPSHLLLAVFSAHLLALELMREMLLNADAAQPLCVRAITASIMWTAQTFAAEVTVPDAVRAYDRDLTLAASARVESLRNTQSDIESEDGFALFSLAQLLENTGKSPSNDISTSRCYALLPRCEQLDRLFRVLLTFISTSNDLIASPTSNPSFFAKFNRSSDSRRPLAQLVLQSINDMFVDPVNEDDSHYLLAPESLPLLQYYVIQFLHETVTCKPSTLIFLRDHLMYGFLFTSFTFLIDHECQLIMRTLILDFMQHAINIDQSTRSTVKPVHPELELRLLLACFAYTQGTGQSGAVECALAIVDMFIYHRLHASSALVAIIDDSSSLAVTCSASSRLIRPFAGLGRSAFTIDLPIPQLFTLILARESISQRNEVDRTAFLFMLEFAVFSSSQVRRSLMRDGAFALQLLELVHGTDSQRHAALRMTIALISNVGDRFSQFNATRRTSLSGQPLGTDRFAHRRMSSADESPSVTPTMPVRHLADKSLREDEEMERSKRLILGRWQETIPMLGYAAPRVLEDWLSALRKFLGCQTQLHQDSLRRRHVIQLIVTAITQQVSAVDLINEYDAVSEDIEATEPLTPVKVLTRTASLSIDESHRLAVSLVLTLGSLLADNYRSVEVFRRAVGWSRLGRLIDHLEQGEPARAVSASLMNLLVDGHFQVNGFDLRREPESHQSSARSVGDPDCDTFFSVQIKHDQHMNASRRPSLVNASSRRPSVTSKAAVHLRSAIHTQPQVAERYTIKQPDVINLLFSRDRFLRCSGEHQLDLLTLFTVMLQRSAINTALAAKSGLVDRILDLFPLLAPLIDGHAEQRPLHKQALELIRACCWYGVSSKQIERLVSLTHSQTQHDGPRIRPVETRLIVEAIELMVQQQSPRAFWLFDGKTGGIELPKLESFGARGWAAAMWIRIESFTAPPNVDNQSFNYSIETAEPTNNLPQTVFHSLSPSSRLSAVGAYRSIMHSAATTSTASPLSPPFRRSNQSSNSPRLLQLFASSSGPGVELFLNDRRLAFAVSAGRGRARVQIIENSQLKENQWYFVCISQAPPSTFAPCSDLKVYIDRACVYSCQAMSFPSINTPLQHCLIGTNSKTERSNPDCFYGAIGGVVLCDEDLSSAQVEAVYDAGSDYFSQDPVDIPPSDQTSSLLNEELTAKIALVYSAKIRNGRTHFNLAPRVRGRDHLKEVDSLAHALDGTYQCATRSCMDAIQSINGIESLFHTLQQLDQPIKSWRKLTAAEHEQRTRNVEKAQSSSCGRSPPSATRSLSRYQPNTPPPRSRRYSYSTNQSLVVNVACPFEPSPSHSPSSSASAQLSKSSSLPTSPVSKREILSSHGSCVVAEPWGEAVPFARNLEHEFTYDVVDGFDAQLLVSILRCFARILENRPDEQDRMLRARGFELIAAALGESSRSYLTIKSLRAMEDVLNVVRTHSELYRDGFFSLLANLGLWLTVAPTVQRHWLRSMAIAASRHPVLFYANDGFQHILDHLRDFGWFEREKFSVVVRGDRPYAANLHLLRAEILSIVDLAISGHSSLQLQSSVAPIELNRGVRECCRVTPTLVRQLVFSIQAVHDDEQLVELLSLLLGWLRGSAAALVAETLDQLDVPSVDFSPDLEHRMSQRSPSPQGRRGFDVLLGCIQTHVQSVRVTALRCLHAIMQLHQRVKDKEVELALMNMLLNTSDNEADQSYQPCILDHDLYLALLSLMIDVVVDRFNESDSRATLLMDESIDFCVKHAWVLQLLLNMIVLGRSASNAESIVILQDISFMFHHQATRSAVVEHWGWSSWMFALYSTGTTVTSSPIMSPIEQSMKHSKGLAVQSYASSLMCSLVMHALDTDRGSKQFEHVLGWLSMYNLPQERFPHLPTSVSQSFDQAEDMESFPVICMAKSLLVCLHGSLMKEAEVRSKRRAALAQLVANVAQMSEHVCDFLLLTLTSYANEPPAYVRAELDAVWTIVEVLLDLSIWQHQGGMIAGRPNPNGVDGQLLLVLLVRVAQTLDNAPVDVRRAFYAAPSAVRLTSVAVETIQSMGDQSPTQNLEKLLASLTWLRDGDAVKARVDRFSRVVGHLVDLNHTMKANDDADWKITTMAFTSLREQHSMLEDRRRARRNSTWNVNMD